MCLVPVELCPPMVPSGSRIVPNFRALGRPPLRGSDEVEHPPMTGRPASEAGIQLVVSLAVSAGFATVYITQPVLPVLQREFGVNASAASLTVSAVVLGIAISNLPFGVAADHFPIRRIILAGGCVVGAASLVCAATPSLPLLVAARFVQGLFIPSLSTCIAAYLARTMSVDRLEVVMGSYVSASVTGGL